MKSSHSLLRLLSVVFYVLAAVNLVFGVLIVIGLAGFAGSVTANLSIIPLPGEMSMVISSLLAGPLMILTSWGSVLIGLLTVSISLLLFAAGRLMRMQIDLFEANERNRELIADLQARIQ